MFKDQRETSKNKYGHFRGGLSVLCNYEHGCKKEGRRSFSGDLVFVILPSCRQTRLWRKHTVKVGPTEPAQVNLHSRDYAERFLDICLEGGLLGGLKGLRQIRQDSLFDKI